MLTQTVKRLEGLVPPERVLVITNAEQREAVLEVCPMLPAENVIAEPVGRDTAAAVGLATVIVGHRDPEAAFAMLPADHVIHDTEGFRSCLETAFAAAEAGDALVTVGITAEYPATGYGYIHRGEAVAEINGQPVYAVESFKEKPGEETAREYVESGDYYWNAGMFFWRVPVISLQFEEHTPGLWKALDEIRAALRKGESLESVLASQYPSLEKVSIDYAIMEKADSVQVVESTFDWDDVGEWPAVARHFPADDRENVTRGRVVLQDGDGNIVINDGKHTTALIGVKDLIVVQTADATLVCPKDKAQEIKTLMGKLRDDPQYKHLL